MKTRKQTRSYIYVLLVLVGLLLMALWPSFVSAVPRAMPQTATQRLRQSWQFAGDMGSYRYKTTVVQTTHPTEKLVNVGRSSSTQRFSVAGMMDRPSESMRMTMSAFQGGQAIEIKVEAGIPYGRLQAAEEWQELDHDTTDMFAPGGDPLGYLNAAENVQEVGTRSGKYGVGGADLDSALTTPTPYFLLHLHLRPERAQVRALYARPNGGVPTPKG